MTDAPESKDQDFVALIENPYGLNTVEISEIKEAQATSEPLDLADAADEADLSAEDEEIDAIDISQLTSEKHDNEEPAPLDETQMERISGAMGEAEAEAAAKAAASQEEEVVDSAAELAAQIAEDQELARQLAEEAEQAEESDQELMAALPSVPATLENGDLDLKEMESCIEALLFMTDKSLSVEKLRTLLGPDFPLSVFQEALTSLCDRYKATHHGFELVEIGGGYQFRTKPGRAALAKKLSKIQTQRLSSGGMESLAIIAYKQPVMKEDIDKIRGVDSSYFIRGLLDKKLIQISGRSELPGRPMLYTTTQEFLEVFGLKDLASMPPLHEVEKMIPASQSGNPDEDDPRVKEMRRLVGQMKTDTSTSLLYNPREDEKILKEIRERVNSIPISTPYLQMQEELEKQAELAARQPAEGQPVEEAMLPPPAPGGEQASLPV